MYDSSKGALDSALKATSSVVFTAATIDSILSLVSSDTDTKVVVDTATAAANTTVRFTAGTEVGFVQTSDTAQTKVALDGTTPVVFFEGKGGVDATFSATGVTGGKDIEAAAVKGGVERVVMTSAGADKITILDSKNTQVIAGDKDIVTAGKGHTVVVAAQGSSTVVGGGDTVVQASGSAADFTVTGANGHAKIVNNTTHVAVDISKAQYVQLDGGEALIFAANAKQAAVAELYHAAFGRTGDAAGLSYWFAQADKGLTVKQIAQSFVGSAEYKGAALSNAQFVDGLYHNVLGRNADAGGATFWVDSLTKGVSRADVAAAFADAAANTATSHEATVVGSVTVIDHIV